MDARRFDPAQKKNKDKRNAEKKIHRVGLNTRTAAKQDLRRLLNGEITEEEFEEVHGEDREVSE